MVIDAVSVRVCAGLCVSVSGRMCLSTFDLFCLFISFMGHLEARREGQRERGISRSLSPPLSV